MKTKILAAAVGVATLAMAGSASAVVLLADNFDSQTPDQLNWAGDSVFLPTSPPGTVDLIGTGGAFDFYPGNGGYLDLDGSSGSGNDPAGEITSIASFVGGAYTLTFQLGGNARGAPAQTTRISLGSFSTDVALASGDPLTDYSFTFNTTGGQLKFTELGPSNQQGNILDDVELSTSREVVPTVPEPATWAMMLMGFGGLGAALRRRRSLALAT